MREEIVEDAAMEIGSHGSCRFQTLLPAYFSPSGWRLYSNLDIVAACKSAAGCHQCHTADMPYTQHGPQYIKVDIRSLSTE